MKNKVLSILAIFITFITLSCKTDLIEKETTPQGKGLISIKIGNNAKMLSPNTDKIDISSINWTVTFTNKQDTTKQLKRSTSIGTLKEYLPFGTYIIEIEGITQSAEDGSTAIAFYGKTEAAISPEEKTTTANIYVAPKKSENGTGSFEYIITMTDPEFLQSMDNKFTAKLASINDNLTPIEITTTAEKKETEAYTTYTITFSQDKIPSGYYTLTISCPTIPNPDNPISTTQILQKNILVEICDNAKTSDSIELQIDGYKTLYAVTPVSGDGNKYANYSGEFKKYPADFLNILNDDTITNAVIYMLNQNIPIINPSKIKDKIFDICLYNETTPEKPEYYGSTYKDYDETKLGLEPNKSLMLLGNDNYEESILNLYISSTQVSSEPTTQVTLLNGSPSIYLYETSSKFEFDINTLSDYYDKPFMQCDVPQDSDEYLLKILADDNTKIESFDGIKLNDNYTDDKVVYSSTSKTIDGNTCNNIQYFILPNHKGSMPDTIIISADKTELYIDEKVTFTIQGEFTAGTQFKWYANRKLVQNGPNKSYTHTAQFTTDEVLCFIYQDENNYITVDATKLIFLNITPDTTPIALYSAVSNLGSYYLYNLTLADVKNISKGEKNLNSNNSLIQGIMHYDNCYDDAGTLWWVTDSGIYNSNNSETAVITDLSNLRYIDFDKNTLYATRLDGGHTIYKITEEDIGKYLYDTLFYTEALITCITFHNDYCYTIEKVPDDTDGNTITYTLKKYPLQSNTSITDIKSEVQTALLTTTSDEDNNEIITCSDLIFDNDKSIVNTLKNPLFSDIQVTDEGIFVLFNDCYYNKDYVNQTIDANSRGGIIKFKNNLQLDTTFGTNGIFGLKNEKHTSSGTNDIRYTITSYMPDFPADTQLSSKYFYGPRKFLAIKPKKLIFADDGFMFYGNNDDPSGKDVNQVIEFDIGSAMFNSYNLGQSIDFDKRAIETSSVAASFNWHD